VVLSVLSTLAYASYLDLKDREVPEYVWLPGSLISITVNLYIGAYSPIKTVISLIPALAVLALAFLDLIGGADFFALLLVSLAHPNFLYLPISLLTLFYSLLIPVGVLIWYVMINLRHYSELRNLRCVNGSRYYLLFFGKPVSVNELLRKKFLYPLMIPEGDGFRCRASFTMDDDFEAKIKKAFKDLMAEGKITDELIVWATPGFPHVVFYLIGYVVALLTPQQALLNLLLEAIR